MRGLKTDVEYVFAVAGYSAQGELVGGSIGATGRTHLASFSYPLLSAWGELCKVSLYNYSSVLKSIRVHLVLCFALYLGHTLCILVFQVSFCF